MIVSNRAGRYVYRKSIIIHLIRPRETNANRKTISIAEKLLRKKREREKKFRHARRETERSSFAKKNK